MKAIAFAIVAAAVLAVAAHKPEAPTNPFYLVVFLGAVFGLLFG